MSNSHNNANRHNGSALPRNQRAAIGDTPAAKNRKPYDPKADPALHPGKTRDQEIGHAKGIMIRALLDWDQAIELGCGEKVIVGYSFDYHIAAAEFAKLVLSPDEFQRAKVKQECKPIEDKPALTVERGVRILTYLLARDLRQFCEKKQPVAVKPQALQSKEDISDLADYDFGPQKMRVLKLATDLTEAIRVANAELDNPDAQILPAPFTITRNPFASFLHHPATSERLDITVSVTRRAVVKFLWAVERGPKELKNPVLGSLNTPAPFAITQGLALAGK